MHLPPKSAVEASSSKSSYLPQLDGLRGLAILSVMFHHYSVHLHMWIDPGPVGVRIFFILSGYLITLSLWKMVARPISGPWWAGGIGGYHIKRLVRLAPILYVMLGMGFLLGLPEFRDGIWWHMGFLTNFFILATGEWPGALSHLWSIAIQEQFYIIWPLVLLVIPRRWLPHALGLFFVSAFVFRYLLMAVDASAYYRWMLLPGALDSFALGGLLACWKRAARPIPIARGWGAILMAILALAAWIVSRQFRYATEVTPIFAITETIENVVLGWIVLRTLVGWPGWIGKVFEFAPLTYIGKISYGIYIFHVLVHVVLGPWLDLAGLTLADQATGRACVMAVVSIGVASLSYFYLELPLAAWIRRRQASPGTRAALSGDAVPTVD